MKKGEGFQVYKLVGDGKMEPVEWAADQDAREDYHIQRTVHCGSIQVLDRLYIFSNLCPSAPDPVKIVDFQMNRLFPVSQLDCKPSALRLSYCIASWKHKIYIHGGVGEKAQLLDTMDEFDVTTYKFAPVKYRGEAFPKGRACHSAIVMDQYNMYLIGGTDSSSFIDPEPLVGDNAILVFDIDASTWSQVRGSSRTAPSDPEPANLVHNSSFKLSDLEIGVIWYERVLRDQGNEVFREMKASIFNRKSLTWKNIELGEPAIRFRVGCKAF